jgi:hypothetical protein
MIDDKDPIESQKQIARIQIWSNTCVAFGGVSLGIGASMWVTSYSLLGSVTDFEKAAPLLAGVINAFSILGPFFSILGFSFVLGGFLYPMYLLRRKAKQLDPLLCHCGNKLPCTIHRS